VFPLLGAVFRATLGVKGSQVQILSSRRHRRAVPFGGVPPVEAYETKAAALKGCESVQRAADGATIVETDS
jgi:hypothetical protein